MRDTTSFAVRAARPFGAGRYLAVALLLHAPVGDSLGGLADRPIHPPPSDTTRIPAPACQRCGITLVHEADLAKDEGYEVDLPNEN